MRYAAPSSRAAALLSLALSLLPSLAYAHVGVGPTAGWAAGLSHPLSGLDHMCAAIAVGLLAACCDDRRPWLLPSTFVLAMALGMVLALRGVAFPFAAGGVTLSVAALGLIVSCTAAITVPQLAQLAIVAAFALCHGHVHGTEIPTGHPGVAYGVGLVTATALLHATGVVIGRLPIHHRGISLAHVVGIAMTLYGLQLLAS